MASKVEICNLALTHIGQRAISSLEEPITSARTCKLLFDSIRDSVLRENHWNFATTIEELAMLSGEDVMGWNFVYVVPSKCLNARKIYNEETVSKALPDPFKEMLSPITKTKIIATNTEFARLEYTYQVTDTNLFDANFIEALSYRLAAALAQPVAGNPQLADSLLRTYGIVLDKAKLSNAKSGVDQRKQYSSYVESR